MNVLSLFDGMSCGQIALNRLGVKYDNYFACEIDKYAIKVTQENFPNTKQLGDVTKVDFKSLPKIDLLIGGSPCQGFSFAGKQLNFNDPRSALFFEFVRALREANPKYFLLENVRMKKEYQDVISEHLGVEPVIINSSLVSAQNRVRLYWSNIPIIQPEDKKIFISEILEKAVDKKYYLSNKMINGFLNKSSVFRERFKSYIDGNEKSYCLTARYFKQSATDQYIMQVNPCLKAGGKQPRMQDRIYFTEWCKSPALTSFASRLNVSDLKTFKVRKLTPIECERLQTVPDNYTNHVSNTQRYKMLGNGWTIDVICHILKEVKI